MVLLGLGFFFSLALVRVLTGLSRALRLGSRTASSLTTLFKSMIISLNLDRLLCWHFEPLGAPDRLETLGL